MTLTKSRLQELLHYDTATGLFTWRVRRRRVVIGHVAGCENAIGYWCVGIEGVKYLAHRLAWFYMTGEWPDRVDHINMVKTDNRWSNLRNGTGSLNLQNRKNANSNNKSGYLGVTTFRGMYQARIMIDGRGKFLGSFSDPEQAHLAYVKAKREIHPGCTI